MQDTTLGSYGSRSRRALGVLPVASNFPAARTIREFRWLRLADFMALFVQVVKLAREPGLARRGAIAVDGMKVRPTRAATRR
jgi:hypothetical protein